MIVQLMADKSFDDDDWEDGDRVTAEEFLNPHAEKGHWPADELNLRMDNGDPVVLDPQSDEVIMRWDRTEGEWVFDSIRSTAVSTEDLESDSIDANTDDEIEQKTNFIIDASTVSRSHILRGRGDGGNLRASGHSTTVSTSDVALAEAGRSKMVLVWGADDEDRTVRFVDLVLYHGFGSASIEMSHTRRSPEGRNYSVDGDNLELAMDDGEYQVGVFDWGI